MRKLIELIKFLFKKRIPSHDASTIIINHYIEKMEKELNHKRKG